MVSTVVLEGKEGSCPGTLKGEAGATLLIGLAGFLLLLLVVVASVLWAFMARKKGGREGGRDGVREGMRWIEYPKRARRGGGIVESVVLRKHGEALKR